MPNYSTISSEKEGPIGFITLNRPDKLNALNTQCLMELDDAFAAIDTDDSIRVVLLTGSGEKAFAAGADIKELSGLNTTEAVKYAEFGQSVFNRIEKLSKPVVAAVNGFALGGGAELAWSCHIRIASEKAKFGQPEINLGLIPGYAGTQRLTRMLPRAKAYELLLTGEMIDANTALAFGLVNYIVPLAELQAKAKELALKLSEKPARSMALLMKAVRAVNESTLTEGQAIEAALFGLCFGTEDFREGTAAFLEKRKPEYKHK